MKKSYSITASVIGAFALWLAGCRTHEGQAEAGTPSANDRFAGYRAVVEQTHRRSLQLRKQVLRETIAEDSYWIDGNWGECLWSLSALYLNEKTERVNEWLLGSATAYCAAMKAEETGSVFAPGKFSGKSPWAYFALADYTRMLCLFRADSAHFPGRLRPETEAAMKEALWSLVKGRSRVAEASLDHLLVHHGTENHDLTLRPNYYLIASVLKDDPEFKYRKYDDGYTAAEHFAAYNAYFREWPRKRAMIGMWFEMGSDTYQKYSWPALINLHELSPDPVVRKRFGMLLDLALIEEAQVSFRGRRGGGRSRAGYGKNNFEKYKNLLYAPEGVEAEGTHHKVFETSTYQAPAAAIMLRKMAFPAPEPFVIVNRVPGEIAEDSDARKYADKNDTRNPYTSDSALLNYAYRTPHYLLGSTLQNPGLSMEKDGKAVLKYSGISRQNRWSGMLFTDPDTRFPLPGVHKERYDDELCAVYPVVEKTRGGRPQHPHWSFQHENVLFMQRITPQRGGMGSYGTGRMSIRFHGRGLEKTEKNGWIFASNGKAFVAVRFLDGGYEWDETGEVAHPANFESGQTTRFLIHAGDVTDHPSFEAFRTAVVANPPTVKTDRVEYRPAPAGPRLECFRYDVATFRDFKLPRVAGKPINLRPDWTYKSPYLNGRFGDDRVTVTVGPIERVYDFGEKE